MTLKERLEVISANQPFVVCSLPRELYILLLLLLRRADGRTAAAHLFLAALVPHEEVRRRRRRRRRSATWATRNILRNLLALNYTVTTPAAHKGTDDYGPQEAGGEGWGEG